MAWPIQSENLTSRWDARVKKKKVTCNSYHTLKLETQKLNLKTIQTVSWRRKRCTERRRQRRWRKISASSHMSYFQNIEIFGISMSIRKWYNRCNNSRDIFSIVTKHNGNGTTTIYNVICILWVQTWCSFVYLGYLSFNDVCWQRLRWKKKCPAINYWPDTISVQHLHTSASSSTTKKMWLKQQTRTATSQAKVKVFLLWCTFCCCIRCFGVDQFLFLFLFLMLLWSALF